MNKLIQKRLKALPPISDNVFELLNFQKNGEMDTKKLLKIIGDDSMMTTRVLKMANSKLFGFQNSVETLSKALELFGINFTISIAISESIRNSLKIDLDAYGLLACEFDELSELSCKLFLRWLKDENIEFKERLILPIFLHELGKFVISDTLKREQKDKQFLFQLEEQNSISKVEREFVGVSSSELSALILKEWGFPQNIVETVFNIDRVDDGSKNKEKSIVVVSIIKEICNPFKPFDEVYIKDALEKADTLNLDSKRLKEVVDSLPISSFRK